MKKIITMLAILCISFCMFFSIGTISANAEEANPVYTYTEGDAVYNLTLVDEDDFTLNATNSGSEIVVTGKYTIEDNIITLTVAGEELERFLLKEDMTMEIFEEKNPKPEIDVPISAGDYKAQIEELNILIEKLYAELRQEEVNYEEVGKIAVGILGIVGMIVLGLLIVIVRLKIKNINKDKLYQDVKEETDKIFADYQKEVKDLIEDVKTTVTKKIDDTEEKRQAEAEAQSIKLRASVEAAKANLSINNVLDD